MKSSLYEIHLFSFVLILLYRCVYIYTYTYICVYSVLKCIFVCVLYAYSHVCRDVCRGTSPPEEYLTWVYGYKSIWRPDVFLNHSPLFKTFIFNYCVWSLDTCMQCPLRPQAPNSLELEWQTVVNHLTWVLRTKLGSFARTNCALSHILYWGGVSQLCPEFA